MTSKNLNAQTQYNDWLGEIALDDQDFKGIREHLKNKLQDRDIIIGIDTYFLGEFLDKNEKIEVKAYVTNKDLGEKVREVKFEIDLEMFFKLFKRIHITASRKNQLKGKIIEVIQPN